METLDTTIALILSAIVSLYFGKILPIVLPRLNRKLDRKPFNCRPCFTFHLTWILTSISALSVSSLKLFIAGVTTAFLLFFLVKYIDNKKIIK
ncbi:MAG: hypothetical protein ACK5KT_11510 [Dysgonomonas sp.]